ncbi:Bisanhydrobacterioruberin hydratase CruF-like protein [Aduncisulcus paluster]|uniref:Bisanhydrobacterioruberin hydratase CruF-like protein n=1 Tax=Aduncisulcus paluster TaxID=2918883 RepID=A0ABQ5KUK8_9EUKA|nr:Bisanhydrobacterioruberin hydratase CruF-like protein [Aduncisulcus paluster]
MDEIDLSWFITPLSWLSVEVLSIVLLFYVISDAITQFKKSHAIMRIGEFFAFMLYAGLYENVGVGANIYYYSLNRFIMFGRVPLSVLIIEAAVFYSLMRLAEKTKMPLWSKPFLVGLGGLLSDLTIDPSSVFDLHLVNGVMEGRWNWTTHYDNLFFGIPFFNFTGWFTMMFYFSTFVLLGREIYEKKQQKMSVGVAYILISVLLSLVVLVSPINTFLLFMQPIFPQNTRIAEITMLLIISTISTLISWKFFSLSTPLSFSKDRIIWLIPIVLHIYDILAAFLVKIRIAYIPSLLFGIPHSLLLWWMFRRNQSNTNRKLNPSRIKGEKKI